MGKDKKSNVIEILDEFGCWDYCVVSSEIFEFNTDYGLCYFDLVSCRVFFVDIEDYNDDAHAWSILVNKELKKIEKDG